MSLPEIIGLVANIVTSISIVVVIVELYSNRKDQQVSRLYYLHNYLAAEQFAQARYHVRHELESKQYSLWSAQDKIMANLVCASYDQAGVIFSFDLINVKLGKTFLKSSWGESICDQYEILEPFMKDKQTPKKTGVEFFRHFHDLYMQAKQIRN